MDPATNQKLAAALVSSGGTLENNFVRAFLLAHKNTPPGTVPVVDKATAIIANAYQQGITITASMTQLLDPADVSLNALITTHVQQFLANETQAVQDAVKQVNQRAFQYGWNQGQISRRLAQIQGLDGRFSGALLNYEQGLQSQGLNQGQITRQVEDYRKRLVRARAKTIARTEVMSALNAGSDVAWRQAVQNGTLPPDSQRVWIVYHDERLCDLCAPMQFQSADIGQPFNSSKGGKIMSPPLHPNCRCTTGVISTYGAKNTSRMASKLGISKSLRAPEPLIKGDKTGHPFRGNQWTGHKKLEPGGPGTAPDGGWDMSGPEPRWVQPHETLVRDALHSWVGAPDSMRIHMQHELDGAPQSGSGSGKIMRAQAAALLKEIRENGKPTPKLYRGAKKHPGLDEIPRSWSTNKATAERFAKRSGGTVETLPAGAGVGIRMSDYIKSQLDEYERQWLVVSPASIIKGDRTGHPFRGNQYTNGTGALKLPAGSQPIKNQRGEVIGVTIGNSSARMRVSQVDAWTDEHTAIIDEFTKLVPGWSNQKIDVLFAGPRGLEVDGTAAGKTEKYGTRKEITVWEQQQGYWAKEQGEPTGYSPGYPQRHDLYVDPKPHPRDAVTDTLVHEYAHAATWDRVPSTAKAAQKEIQPKLDAMVERSSDGKTATFVGSRDASYIQWMNDPEETKAQVFQMAVKRPQALAKLETELGVPQGWLSDNFLPPTLKKQAISKANPYHDDRGRFTTGPKGGLINNGAILWAFEGNSLEITGAAADMLVGGGERYAPFPDPPQDLAETATLMLDTIDKAPHQKLLYSGSHGRVDELPGVGDEYVIPLMSTVRPHNKALADAYGSSRSPDIQVRGDRVPADMEQGFLEVARDNPGLARHFGSQAPSSRPVMYEIHGARAAHFGGDEYVTSGRFKVREVNAGAPYEGGRYYNPDTNTFTNARWRTVVLDYLGPAERKPVDDITKHLPGKHDQKSHAGGKGRLSIVPGEPATQQSFSDALDQDSSIYKGEFFSHDDETAKFNVVNQTAGALEEMYASDPKFAAEIDKMIAFDRAGNGWGTVEYEYRSLVRNGFTPDVANPSVEHKWMVVRTQNQVDSWAASSSSSQSLALGLAASRMMGIPMRWPTPTSEWAKNIAKAKETYKTDKAFLDAYAKVTYKHTQEYLAARGIKEVTVFRGSELRHVGVHGRVDRQQALEIGIPDHIKNAARSWETANKEKAAAEQAVAVGRTRLRTAVFVNLDLMRNAHPSTSVAFDNYVRAADFYGRKGSKAQFAEFVGALKKDKFLSPAQKALARSKLVEINSLSQKVAAARLKEALAWNVLDTTQKDISDWLRAARSAKTMTASATGNVQLRPITSFSMHVPEAAKFGPEIIGTKVPVQNIFATAYTGPGCLREREVLVMSPSAGISATIFTLGKGPTNFASVIEAVTGTSPFA